MREECKDGQEIVRPEKVLVWRHMKASSGKVEIGVEMENSTAIEDGANMHKQEERKQGA